MNGSFYEQLGGVAGLFDQWGACERTVVACALARRVPWPGLRLLQRAVEAALRHHASDESLERDANDELYLTTMLAPRPADDDDDGEKRLQKLITLLPLLRTDNVRAKEAWVSGAGGLVQRTVDAPPAAAARDLCRQLLSYLLVHPALSSADQRTLTQWLRYLENHISGNRTTESVWQQRIDPSLLTDTNIWSSTTPFRRTIGKNVFRSVIDTPDTYTTDLLQESFSKNGRDVDISIENDRTNFDAAISQPKSQRSNSLTPPSTNFMQMSSSAENLSDEQFVQKPRSFSLSSEHSLSQIRPISIMYGTAGSETRLDDLRSHNYTEHPGMSTVAQWLKSLRLHKYVWLFTNISYEQMMAIDERYLEKLGVTKGARHKILLSIKKLSERGAVLESLESELSGAPPAPALLLRSLERLRAVLLSPMPPGSDLPPVIVRILHLAWKCVGVAAAGAPPTTPGTPSARPAPDDEPTPLALHCWLVEKALHHEAFRSAELKESLTSLRHRVPPRQFYHHVSDMPHRSHHHHHARWRSSNHFYNNKRSASGGTSGGGGGWATGPAAPRGKSHSYPPYPAPAPAPAPAPPLDYAGLDALCLQMTEQAID